MPSGVCQPILPMPMGCVMTVRRPSSTSPFLSFGRLRVIKHAQLRKVYNQAFARRVRQYELSRHDDRAPDTRQPRIDARIGAQDFFVADVEAACDVGKRVLALHVSDLELADDFVMRRIEAEFMRRHRRPRSAAAAGGAGGVGSAWRVT